MIGAGVAGLFAGLFLARSGLRPVVLEQSYHAGGCLNGFTRKGFTFDAGDQSFEELGIVFSLLADLGLRDRFRFKRSSYRLVAPRMDAVIRSIQSLEDAFTAAFPGDARGVASLFGALRDAEALLTPVIGADGPLSRRGLRRAAGLAGAGLHVLRHGGRLRRMMNTGARDLAEAHLGDPVLRDFVARIGYKNMSWAVFAGFLHCWVDDYWYPEGGLQSFCDGLAAALAERGGEVRYKTAATRVLTERGRVVGVETARGERIATRRIIAGGDAKRLFGEMLPAGPELAETREAVLGAALSEALTSVYLGVDASPEQLAPVLKTHHVFYFPDFDVHDPQEAEDSSLHSGAWLEISSPTLTDPSLAPPGKSVVVLQTMAPAAWLDQWGRRESPTKDAYRALKDRVAREMIGTAEGLIPDLSRKILYRDVGT
ncbi:MAG: phytoene desaturase family protein, partial [Myxococcota bacterium]